MNCANHEQTLASAVCSKCQRPLCDQCAIRWKGMITCKTCLESGGGKSGKGSAFRKSPSLAGFLALLPGLGQTYVGFYVAGFVNILVFASLISMCVTLHERRIVPFFVIFLVFFYLFNIVDAVRRAKLYNLSQQGESAELVPTDSPLIGGIILLLLGFLLVLQITFDLELDFLSDVWPLGLVFMGGYLIWKYRKARAELQSRTERDSGPIRPLGPDLSSSSETRNPENMRGNP